MGHFGSDLQADDATVPAIVGLTAGKKGGVRHRYLQLAVESGQRQADHVLQFIRPRL